MNEKFPPQRRFTEIAGLLCLAVALFLLLALLSYHPLDPSLTRYVPEETTLHNWTGAAGSYTADALIRLFGIGILWLPVLLLIASIRFFRTPRFRISASAIIGLAGLVFATSGIFELTIGKIVFYGIPLHLGGLLGTVTAGFLDGYLRMAGSLIILGLILIVALMILFDFSVVSFAGRSAAAAGTTARTGIVWMDRLKEKLGKKPKAPVVKRT
ncbi:MAG: DNA translocase FtsK 4TM domain-containing protein, partial [Syntrophales bacterium]|nr:DNA translocase FtsK 4TM domain-containing protein [Syntrophales bacterium]